MHWLGHEGGEDVKACLSNVTRKLLSHEVQLGVNLNGAKGKAKLIPLDEIIFGEFIVKL